MNERFRLARIPFSVPPFGPGHHGVVEEVLLGLGDLCDDDVVLREKFYV